MTEFEARRIEHEQFDRLVSVLDGCGQGLHRMADALEAIASAIKDHSDSQLNVAAAIQDHAEKFKDGLTIWPVKEW